MRVFLLGLLFASCGAAQIPASTPAPASSYWYGAGVSLFPQSRPAPTGNAFLAVWSNAKGSLVNIEEIDFTYVRATRSISTSIIASAATPMTILGRTLYGFVGVGGATGATSSAAFSTGGFAAIAIGKGFYFYPGAKLLKTAAGGSQAIVFLDWGRK
jgi:hypothetical protein